MHLLIVIWSVVHYNIITLLQWKLPKDLDRLFNELKMGLTTVCAYVLIAKAKELILMQVRSPLHIIQKLKLSDTFCV